MTKDPSIWLCVVLTDVVYFISFFLPVYDLIGRVHLGWEVFTDLFLSLFQSPDVESLAGNLVMWAPNPLLWAGVICLGARRPHFALVAGVIAAGSAGWTLYSVEYYLLGDGWHTLWERSGAYLWFSSMMLLAAASLIFTIKQWRQTGRLPMFGEGETGST